MTRRVQAAALAHALAACVLLVALHGTVSAHQTSSGSLPGTAERRAVNVPIGDFSLTDEDGRDFRFEGLRGKVVLVAFVYTTCPDRCPLVTAALRSVQTGLAPRERDATYILSITTDPEVDVPAVLKSYAGRYGVDFSNWTLLTGKAEVMAPVWKTFGVAVERKARGLVDHTLLTGLVDQKGVLRFVYHGGAPAPAMLLGDLRSLLASP